MSSYAQERQSLMTRLLDAVKQCQIRFGGKTELATEADSRVSCLCAAWEAVLFHGLKHTNKALSTLKQVSEITGLARIGSAPGLSLLGEIKNIETEPVFWQCVKEILSKHELQRYRMLKQITTEAGRGRAWLRSALNEHSLEKYMHMVLDNDTLVSRHYEEWSFLCDQEKASMLPNMAAGLGSILFAIGIDHEELNAIKPATGLDTLISSTTTTNSGYLPRGDVEPRPVIAADGSPTMERKKKKKKVKKSVKIVSFDEGDSSVSASPASSVSSSVVTSPRTTSSGIDFSNFSNIVSTSRAHQGFLPRQGSADSQSSQGSLSYTRPVYLPKQSSTESNSSVSSRGVPVGKITTNSNSGETNVNDAKSVQILTKGYSGEDLVSDVISKEVIERLDSSVVQDDMGNIETVQETPLNISYFTNSSESQSEPVAPLKDISEEAVNSFSNPFEEDIKSKTPERKENSSDSKTVETAVVSQDSVESSLSSIPDIIDINLVTPLKVEKAPPSDKPGQPAKKDNSPPWNKKVSFSIYDDPITASLDESLQSDTDKFVEDLVTSSEPQANSVLPDNPTVPVKKKDHNISDIRKAPNGSTSVDQEHGKNGVVEMIPYKSSSPHSKPATLHRRTASWTSNTSNMSATSDSSHSVASYQDIPSNLTPLGPDGTIHIPQRTASFSVSEDRSSIDSSDVQHTGYNDMTYSAAVALAMAQKGLADHMDTFSSLRTQGDGSNTPDPVHSDTMTTVELKQAVIAMMLRKDEVEEHNKHLRAMFETEIEVSTALRAELEEAKNNHLARQDRDAEKIKALSRENELLKHQLKKYVNAVQMLRRQGAKPEDFPGLHMEDEPEPPIPPRSSEIDYSLEASEYEKKLIQVAEMHGELMEFNEMLQRNLLAKEALIRRVKDELVELRGPLPEDSHLHDEGVNVISDPADYSISRSLIHIWIPSAFLRGATSDAFHVYQIYIRIKDDEWNVYRRYSEFKDLHDKLKKKYHVVNTFNFPKKKAIGNKDPKFVEERRKQLQQYIRKVVNQLSHHDPDLTVNICKQKLLESAPFFGDRIEPDKKKGKGRGKNKTRGAAGGSGGHGASNSPVPGPSENQYMGL